MNIIEIFTIIVSLVVFKMGFSYILYDSFYRPVDNKGINKQKYCYGVAKKTLLKQRKNIIKKVRRFKINK